MRGLILAAMVMVAGCGQAPSDRVIAETRAQTDKLNTTVAEVNTELELAKPWPKWLVSLDTSPITDEPSVQITTQSQKLDGPYGHERATLMVLCREKAPSIVITWPRPLDGDGRIKALFRFGSDPAKELDPSKSTDDFAFGWWGWKEAQPVLDQILAADRLVVRATANDGAIMDAEFNVTSLGAHMPKVEAACPK
jgi:hypothetical protein